MPDPLATQSVGLPPSDGTLASLGRSVWFPWACCFTSFSLLQAAASLGAAAFLLLMFLLAGLHLRRSLKTAWQSAPLLVFPAACALSTLWSDAPALTLRYSLQYAATAVCAIIAARSLRPQHFLSALMLSTLVSLTLSLVFGEYRYDGVSKSYAFIGIFGSKNFLAFIITISILTALVCLVDKMQPAAIRILSGLALVIAPVTLARTHSATSFVTSALCAGIFVSALWFRRISGSSRAIILSCLCVSFVLSLVVLEELQVLAATFIQDVLGKDTTLTGRTYLWDRAAYLIAESPLLGRGFQAFWRQEFIEAEALWRYFGITSRGGFHFHNTYIQTTVDLGYVGLAILISLLAFTTYLLSAWYVSGYPLVPSAFLSLIVLLLIRSFVEVDITYQFQLGTVIFYAMSYYGLSARTQVYPVGCAELS